MEVQLNRVNAHIKTDTGYRPFGGIISRGKKRVITIRTALSDLICTPDHRLIDWKMEEVFAQDIKVGQKLLFDNNTIVTVNEVIDTNEETEVFDIFDVQTNRYIANGLVNHNCAFVGEESTLIDGMVLANIQYADPLYIRDSITWFQPIEPNSHYFLTLDPAQGAGDGDYAAIQVFKMPECEQIAEWRSKKADPKKQVSVLLGLLTLIYNTLDNHQDQEYDPEISWTFENNAIGQAILQVIEHTGEEYFPGYMVNEPRKKGQIRRSKGLNTNKNTKLQACLKLKYLIESRRMIIHSKALLRELKNYIAMDNTYAAKSGETDDLVSATLLIVRLAEIVGKNDDDIYDVIDSGIDVDSENLLEPLPVLF